jgi:hypothetical protein
LCLLTYSIHLTLKYRDIEQDINTDLLKENHYGFHSFPVVD